MSSTLQQLELELVVSELPSDGMHDANEIEDAEGKGELEHSIDWRMHHNCVKAGDDRGVSGSDGQQGSGRDPCIIWKSTVITDSSVSLRTNRPNDVSGIVSAGSDGWRVSVNSSILRRGF